MLARELDQLLECVRSGRVDQRYLAHAQDEDRWPISEPLEDRAEPTRRAEEQWPRKLEDANAVRERFRRDHRLGSNCVDRVIEDDVAGAEVNAGRLGHPVHEQHRCHYDADRNGDREVDEDREQKGRGQHDAIVHGARLRKRETWPISISRQAVASRTAARHGSAR